MSQKTEIFIKPNNGETPHGKILSSVILLCHKVRNTFSFIALQSCAWWTYIRILPLTGKGVCCKWKNGRNLHESSTRILRINSRHCEKGNDAINEKYFSFYFPEVHHRKENGKFRWKQKWKRFCEIFSLAMSNKTFLVYYL